MAKLHLDKYYTPQSFADYCIQKVIEVIGIENITELVESSAGNGAFLNSFEKFLPNIPYQAYDIEPEDDRIVKQDYLELEMEYKVGRVVGFNFPFGKGNTLSVKFYKKSLKFGDYICSILPISQLNNNQQMYEFDLIYSEDLKICKYSDIELHCCFNIYKRNSEGLNVKRLYNLKCVDIVQTRKRNGNVNKVIDINDYDISFCIRRNGSFGKICYSIYDYNDIIHIKIKNDIYRDLILHNIHELLNSHSGSISSKSIKTWQVYKYLKEKIPELE